MLKGRERRRSNLHLQGLRSGDGEEGLSGEKDHSKGDHYSTLGRRRTAMREKALRTSKYKEKVKCYQR